MIKYNQLVDELVCIAREIAMKEIGIFQAKTKFSEIAKRVKSTGRPVRVTNRGEPVVEIVPVTNGKSGRRSKREAIQELMRLRDTLPKVSVEEIKRDIAEGRH
jgi:prevent-host-death family protein